MHLLKEYTANIVAKTDGYDWCSKLAHSHPGTEFDQNSGPAMATDTAETYAYFAMMA